MSFPSAPARRERLLLAAFLAVAAADLAGLLTGSGLAHLAAKPLLMPLLGVPVRTLSPAANGGDLARVSPVWVSPGSYSCAG